MRVCGAEFTSAAPMSMATNLAGALARRSCAISAQRPAAIDHACMCVSPVIMFDLDQFVTDRRAAPRGS